MENLLDFWFIVFYGHKLFLCFCLNKNLFTIFKYFVYNIAIIEIIYYFLCRVQCNYAGRTIAFHVDSGSNQEYFAALIEYEEGDGDLNKVELKEALDSSSWDTMQQSWGAVWKFDKGAPLKAPFSIRLTTLKSGKTIVAQNVIPAGWKPGQTYRSIVNF